MKILYVAMKYNMGRPEQGLSYEHHNFYGTLTRMDNSRHEIIYFPFDEIMLKIGKERMNRMLIKTVNENKPDLCFFELITHQILPDTIREINESGNTVTFNWFTDDEWRFDIFSKYYAPLFDWVSTTDPAAIPKYLKIGHKNIIKTQWAFNQYEYVPDKSRQTSLHDVSFVGKAYGDRNYFINLIKNAGINAYCRGIGWSSGRISQKDMIKLFSHSKINLNFSKVQKNITFTYLLGILINMDINGDIAVNNPREWLSRIKYFMEKRRNQVHGRVFEIPGCGGFMLTEYAEGLDDCYIDNKEIVVFRNAGEMIKKIGYYLNEDKERERIALAGYKRTIRDHTYEKRFKYIFNQIGL